MYVCVPHVTLVSGKARRRSQIFWNLNYMWELHLGPTKEQQVLLPFLQSTVQAERWLCRHLLMPGLSTDIMSQQWKSVAVSFRGVLQVTA